MRRAALLVAVVAAGCFVDGDPAAPLLECPDFIPDTVEWADTLRLPQPCADNYRWVLDPNVYRDTVPPGIRAALDELGARDPGGDVIIYPREQP